mgnify:CR=1 FL=1
MPAVQKIEAAVRQHNAVPIVALNFDRAGSGVQVLILLMERLIVRSQAEIDVAQHQVHGRHQIFGREGEAPLPLIVEELNVIGEVLLELVSGQDADSLPAAIHAELHVERPGVALVADRIEQGRQRSDCTGCSWTFSRR